MKNVLVVWLWFQWKRYVNHFLSKGYNVYWICKTKKTLFLIEKDYGINVSLNILNYSHIDFDIISLALPKEIQWVFFMKYLDFMKNANKVTIEIPITDNNIILEEMKKNKNVYFFLEEYKWLLWTFLNKIKFDIKKIDITMNINTYDNMSIYSNFVHIKNNFLSSNIDISIEDVNIIKWHDYNKWDLDYDIIFYYNWKRVHYSFKPNWILLNVEWKVIKSFWDFSTNLDRLLLLDSSYKKYYFLN